MFVFKAAKEEEDILGNYLVLLSVFGSKVY